MQAVAALITVTCLPASFLKYSRKSTNERAALPHLHNFRLNFALPFSLSLSLFFKVKSCYDCLSIRGKLVKYEPFGGFQIEVL